MGNLIKRIIREEVFSSKHNLCDELTADSKEEIINLLNSMESDDKYSEEIQEILKRMDKDNEKLSSDKDVYNTYLRYIQNIVCR